MLEGREHEAALAQSIDIIDRKRRISGVAAGSIVDGA